MDRDLQWFCYLAIEQGVLTAEECGALLEALGTDTDLLTFAQTALDNDLCDDLDAVQVLANEACEKAAEGPPPETIEIEETETVHDLSDTASAPETGSGGQPAVSAGSADIPDFSQAAGLDNTGAAEFMRNLLNGVRAAAASDLHLSAGAAPFMRKCGRISLLHGEKLDAELSRKLNTALLSNEQRDFFEAEQDFNLPMEMANGGRYRVNLVVHKEGVAGTYHVVPHKIRNLKELGFIDHEVITKLLDFHNGLILITGPAGSGKTTTLAAMVDHLNQNQQNHIICIEEPIEIVHTSKNCYLTQREIGKHTVGYASALKAALREDPDVIVIGELHDLETIEMAITAAETGHLVIGTLHTRDAATTLNRLLDVFPPAQQAQIRAMASESLRGIVCQQLLPGADGHSQVVAAEILVNSMAVSKIIREGRTHHLAGVMQTGQSQGMRSMDVALLSLYQKGRITKDLALANIQSKETLNRIKSGGAASPQSPGLGNDKQKKKTGWFR